MGYSLIFVMILGLITIGRPVDARIPGLYFSSQTSNAEQLNDE